LVIIGGASFSFLIADNMRFCVKIPEVEINANYFFNDSVNDSRYVVLHILQLKPSEHLFNSVFLLQLTLDLYSLGFFILFNEMIISLLVFKLMFYVL
jgi:hypothetical protein